MSKIKLYTRELCGWCIEAKDYLRAQGLAFEEIDVSDPAAYAEMQRISGQRYVPTLVVDDQHVLANFDVGQLQEFLGQLKIP